MKMLTYVAMKLAEASLMQDNYTEVAEFAVDEAKELIKLCGDNPEEQIGRSPAIQTNFQGPSEEEQREWFK